MNSLFYLLQYWGFHNFLFKQKWIIKQLTIDLFCKSSINPLNWYFLLKVDEKWKIHMRNAFHISVLKMFLTHHKLQWINKKNIQTNLPNSVKRSCWNSALQRDKVMRICGNTKICRQLMCKTGLTWFSTFCIQLFEWYPRISRIRWTCCKQKLKGCC